MKSIRQEMIDRNLSSLPILLPNGGCIEALYDKVTGEFKTVRTTKEGSVTVMQQVTGPTPVASGGFPYTLSDLAYWVIKRKDGITAKYVMTAGTPGKEKGEIHTPLRLPGVGVTTSTPSYSLSDYCHHFPSEPIFGSKDKQIHIADFQGLESDWRKFDFVVDCGQVLVKSTFVDDPIMLGDPDLIRALRQYTVPLDPNRPRVLQLDWPDREAPPLHPQFFVDLESQLKGNVVVSCVGGHGRSGTTMVCLMMVMFKDYTPFTAMCHLRALHCPRAIEGARQHEYIGKFGEYLGRVNDIENVKGVKSFKDSFLELDVKSAKPYQAKLNTKGAK